MGIKSYSTISETKAAIAERSIRALKNILHRYIAVYEYKYIHKLPHFTATMNIRHLRSKDLKANYVMNSDFLSILYSKPIKEYKKPKSTIGDSLRMSKYDLPFGKSCELRFTQKKIKLLPLLLKNLQYTQPKTKMKKLDVEKFTRLKRLDSIKHGFAHNRVGLQLIITTLSDNTFSSSTNRSR